EGDEDEDDEEDDPFQSAYEGVTYRDSTGRDDSSLAEDVRPPFDLEEESDRLEKRLRFLSTVARLWQVAARPSAAEAAPAPAQSWRTAARLRRTGLMQLLDELGDHPLPEASGDYESVVEYDRRRVIKEQLVYATINTCLDTTLAVAALRG